MRITLNFYKTYYKNLPLEISLVGRNLKSIVPNLSRIMSSEAENKNQSSEEEIPPSDSCREDALHYDFYGEEDEEGPYKTREQKLQVLKELDNQAVSSCRLEEVYPRCEVTTRNTLVEKIKQVELNKQQIQCRVLDESGNPFDDTNKMPEDIKN